MALDPEIAAHLARVAAIDPPPLPTLTPEQARAAYVKGITLRQGPDFVAQDVAAVHEVSFAGPAGPLAARVYEPAERIAATVVYFHGGGWVIGDLETHDAPCRSLANATRARVVSIDYRLAPEHPFPAPLEDCLAATRWAAAQWPGERLAVAGDSAGGALAAGCALELRGADGPALCAQLLVYPATDPSFGSPSITRNGEGYGLTYDDMVWFAAQYFPEAAMRRDPRVDLLGRSDLAGLAPAVIVLAEFDPLHDEGAAYAAHLEAAGLRVTVVEGPGLIHGFLGMVGISRTAAAVVDEAQGAFASLLT